MRALFILIFAFALTPVFAAPTIDEVCLKANETFSGHITAETYRIEEEQKAYVDDVRRKIDRRSEELTHQIAKANEPGAQPYVVDVAGVGAGPHNAITFANIRAENPEATTIIFELDNRMGTFDKMRGFSVNTHELPELSGNTFPGVPIQPRDLNPRGERYVPSSNFGDVTALAHHYAGSNIVFRHKVIGVVEEPFPGAWPAPYRLTVIAEGPDRIGKARQVYAKSLVINTGMGKPDIHLTHEPSQKIIDTEYSTNRLYLRNPETSDSYAPGIQSVDTFLRVAGDDAAAGKNPMARYGNGSFVVVGKGHGGAIGVEGVAGLNRTLNPHGLPSSNSLTWLGQTATNRQEYNDTLEPKLVARYEPVGKAIEAKQINTLPGHLIEIEKIEKDGKPRFRLVFAEFRDGTGTRGDITVDHVVLSTGYRNEAAELFSGLNANPQRLASVHGERVHYTHNPALAEGDVIGSQVVTTNPDGSEKRHPIYIAGNANLRTEGGEKISPQEKNGANGGFLDILGVRSGALGREVGKNITGKSSPIVLKPHTLTSKRDEKGAPYPYDYTVTEYLIPAPKNQPLLFTNRTATELETKIEAARFMAQFRVPECEYPVNFGFTRDAEGLKMEMYGLDYGSSKIVAERLNQNPRLIQLLNNMFDLQAERVYISSTWRRPGALRAEDLTIGVVNPH